MTSSGFENQTLMLARLAISDLTQETAWQRFSVDYDFPVCFTEDLFNLNNPTFLNAVLRLEPEKLHRLCIFIDQGVIDTFPELTSAIKTYVAENAKSVCLAGEPVVVASGESLKSCHRSVLRMQQLVAQRHIDRHSFIVGIGGGALLDTVGLVAATSHRGIRHIRIPTTVLSQNDSGVGVKNGVNLFGQKNYLGTFAPPFAVLNDYHFIHTLTDRDKIAGMAEAVKVALIRDASFFTWLEDYAPALSRFEPHAMKYMIRRCAELHMQQIGFGGDPFETGSARPLDFGHWSAHRLEALSHYQLRHGEAVAIGIALDARYSVLAGLLEPDSDQRICQLLERLGFDLWHPGLASVGIDGKLKVVSGLSEFREHLGGELTITLLEAIGAGVEVNAIDEQRVASSIDWLDGRQKRHLANVRCIKADLLARRQTMPSADQPLPETNGPGHRQAGKLAIDAVISHLQQWLANRLEPACYSWLHERLQLINETPMERDVYITLGLIPRKLGRDDLQLSRQELTAAQHDCGRLWNPSQWSIDTAARCLVVCTLHQQHPDTFKTLFPELCRTAELTESIAFFQSSAVLPQSEALDTLIGTGLRTHIKAVFEAIAHDNPYPVLYFDQNRWNHMVLKALFIESKLWPIQGLDIRSNAELASILCDYAHERWSAGRSVTPELWRCVGPYANGTMLDDLHRALSSTDTVEQQAALLALMSCPDADHSALQRSHPIWHAMITSGQLTWKDIGKACRYS